MLGEEEERNTFFHNRYMKYIVKNNIVKANVFNYKAKLPQLIQNVPINGYNEANVLLQRNKFGLGSMITEKPTVSVLLFR